MKKISSGIGILLLAVFSVFIVYRAAQTASWNIATWQGSASRNNTTEFEITAATEGGAAGFLPGTDDTNPLGSATKGFSSVFSNDLNLIAANSAVAFGGSAAVSTTTTSGNSQGVYFPAYLGGVTNAVEGSVLCSTTVASGNLVTVQVCPALVDHTDWVGIAKSAVSTGSVVNVYVSGWVLALSTGAVTAGQVLVTTGTVAGYLGPDTTPTTGADVGVALGPGATAGGLVRIQLR